jgi:hypothetical protein
MQFFAVRFGFALLIFARGRKRNLQASRLNMGLETGSAEAATDEPPPEAAYL